MAEKSKTVSFRLASAQRAVLSARAKREKASEGEVARRLVLDGLERDEDILQRLDALGLEEEATRKQKTAIQDEQERLRRDLATALQVLLLNLSDLPEDEVRAVIPDGLRF